jgi:hypothetical protein
MSAPSHDEADGREQSTWWLVLPNHFRRNSSLRGGGIDKRGRGSGSQAAGLLLEVRFA